MSSSDFARRAQLTLPWRRLRCSSLHLANIKREIVITSESFLFIPVLRIGTRLSLLKLALLSLHQLPLQINPTNFPNICHLRAPTSAAAANIFTTTSERDSRRRAGRATHDTFNVVVDLLCAHRRQITKMRKLLWGSRISRLKGLVSLSGVFIRMREWKLFRAHSSLGIFFECGCLLVERGKYD